MKFDFGKFRDSFLAFTSKYRFWIIIYALALLCDTLSTIHFMLQIGPEAELHPVVNLTARLLGPILGPVVGFVGKLIAGILVGMYWRGAAVAILVCASAISIWAGWYNLWGWKVYTPAILDWWPF